MPQLVTRIDEKLAAMLDELIDQGVFESRSDAVRSGLRAVLDEKRRSRVADAIISGYEALPQSDDNFGWTDSSTIAMIADEPW
jgi:Arc/MetJ-type ribon-helix-helix transcriptional regulator